MWSKSVQAWVALAMLTVLAHFSAGAWPLLLVAGMGCYGILHLIPVGVGVKTQNKWCCGAQLLGIYLLLSQLLPCAGAYWTGRGAWFVIPAALGLLGIYACGKRPERVAGVLFWVGALLVVPLVIAGWREINPVWMKEGELEVSIWILLALLLPRLVELTKGGRSCGRHYALTVLLGAFAWAMTAGVLSASVARQETAPLREVGRSISLGQYGNYEATVSVLMTLGWYCFGSLLLYAGGLLWEKMGVKRKSIAGFHAFLTLTSLWFRVKIPAEITVFYVFLVWLVLPNLRAKGNSKKIEKSP